MNQQKEKTSYILLSPHYLCRKFKEICNIFEIIKRWLYILA